MATEKYHLGEQILQVLQDRGMSKAEFARRIYTSRQNVNTLLRREDISVWQLMHIGKVLKFNFFAALAQNSSERHGSTNRHNAKVVEKGQSEFIVLFHRPGDIRMTKAIQCLEAYFGPDSNEWGEPGPPLVFQGVYQLVGDTQNQENLA